MNAALADPAALGDALVALIYASALPATNPELLASKAEARHDFGPTRGPGSNDGRAWRLAEPPPRPAHPWHVAAACSGSTSRSPSRRCGASATIRPRPPCRPRIASPSPARWRSFARALTDASRDTVLRLVAAGRRRLAAITSADDARAIAATAGLGPWRREALAWAAPTTPPASRARCR